MLPKVPELWKLPEFRKCTPDSPLFFSYLKFQGCLLMQGLAESQGAVLLVMAIRQSAGGARKLQGQVSPPLPIPIQPGTTTQLLLRTPALQLLGDRWGQQTVQTEVP